MTNFYSFTESLRQKWLQFFQLNRDWIKLHMQVESVYTPDGGKRPPSYLILGVVNALEPELAQLMQPFSKLNPDADTLIEVLDLHFDPDIALGNRTQFYSDDSRFESADVMSEDSLSDPQTNGHSKDRELEMLVDEHEQALMVSHTITRDENSEISVAKEENHHLHDEVDAFGDISFDDLKEVDSKTTSETALDENGFGEVLSDVWGEGTATQKGEAQDIFAGEELPTGSFDESEIAHLFPNA